MSNFWNAEVERARLRDPVVRAESEQRMIVVRDSHRAKRVGDREVLVPDAAA
jgi:hypothetical protein